MSFLFWVYKNSCFSWLKPLIYGIDYGELDFSSNSMDELPGSFGTSASLALRFGQTIFSLASIFFMCLDVGFFAYTSFWYSQFPFNFFVLVLPFCGFCLILQYPSLFLFKVSILIPILCFIMSWIPRRWQYCCSVCNVVKIRV